MWSRSSSKTGILVCRYSLKTLTMSLSVAVRSTAMMSVRGIMISRTVLSPISMMPWIIWCSCSSITPASSETCSSVSSSSSVRNGARAARPPVSAREMIVTAQRIGPRAVASRSTGPPAASAAATKQTTKTMTSIHSWAFMTAGLSEELADAPVLVYPDDRLGEQRCYRKDRQRRIRTELVGRDGHGVGDDHLLDIGPLQPLHCVAGEHWVGGCDENSPGPLPANVSRQF